MRRAHAACACAGTLIAYKVVPLASLGGDGWKVGCIPVPLVEPCNLQQQELGWSGGRKPGIAPRTQVAAALAARHIGGAVNYVGVAGALDIPASAQAAGLAADNLLCVLYFSFIFQLARRLPPDPPASPAGSVAAGAGGGVPQQRSGMQA